MKDRCFEMSKAGQWGVEPIMQCGRLVSGFEVKSIDGILLWILGVWIDRYVGSMAPLMHLRWGLVALLREAFSRYSTGTGYV